MNQRQLKTITAIAILLTLAGCSSTSNEFVNHDKWAIGQFYTSKPLNHEPAEVMDVHYDRLSDTTLDATGVRIFQETYKFDKDGNLLSLRKVVDSNYIYDMSYRFNDSGRHYRYEYINIDTSRKDDYVRYGKSVMEKPGIYAVYETDSVDRGIVSRTDFSNGPDEVIIDQYKYKSVYMRSIYEYDDGKLMREFRKVDDSSSFFYHYSVKGVLDSIVINWAQGNSRRVVRYKNNEQGDPVLIYEIVNGDIVYTRYIQYRYDDKGNWIRRVARETGGGLAKYQPEGPNPEYRLTVRTIKY